MESACSPHVSVVTLVSSHSPETCSVNLTVDVNVNANSCMSAGDMSTVYCAICTKTSRNGFCALRILNRIRKWMEKQKVTQLRSSHSTLG